MTSKSLFSIKERISAFGEKRKSIDSTTMEKCQFANLDVTAKQRGMIIDGGEGVDNVQPD